MPHLEFKMRSQDGLTLRGHGFEPSAKPKAVVCLVHGIGEHSGRYRYMAEAFNDAGYAFIAFDLRGHGRSEGKRGHAPSYAALMYDIDDLLKETGTRYPGVPLFLYGHSLGGNLAIYFALKQKPTIAGVIASAPLFRLAFQPPAWKTMLLNTLYAMHINLPIRRGMDAKVLSRDTEVIRAYLNDPLVHDRITPALAVDMLRAGEWNLLHAAEFPLPLLLMHGTADHITSAEASAEFASNLESQCTLKLWDGLYHELHNEPGKAEVFDYVFTWMCKQITENQ